MTVFYKPGTVAMVTAYNRPTPYKAVFTGETWRDCESAAFCVDVPTSIRPLVVLDLREQPVEGDLPRRNEPQLLISMLRETAENFFTPDAAALARKVADQIEAQTRPPKPPEPTGVGAVVEDADGARYVRVAGEPGCSWRAVRQPADARFDARRYESIDVVRVLSEGVDA